MPTFLATDRLVGFPSFSFAMFDAIEFSLLRFNGSVWRLSIVKSLLIKYFHVSLSPFLCTIQRLSVFHLLTLTSTTRIKRTNLHLHLQHIRIFFSTLCIIGLRYDDLMVEENDIAQEALRRLELSNPRAAYDRAYRLRVAQQCSLAHSLLPQEQWTKPEEVREILLFRLILIPSWIN